MEKKELKKILLNHKEWLKSGKGAKADFRGADLQDVDLIKADLRLVDFSGATLRSARLYSADLRDAEFFSTDLRSTDLRRANLHSADMFRVNLNDSDLRRANLSNAFLEGSSFIGADLCRANLRGADLTSANLDGANLHLSDLTGTDLSSANLGDAELRGAKDGHICRIDFGGWPVCIRSKQTSIGCETYLNKDWLKWNFDSPEIKEMHPDASKWWRMYGHIVQSAIIAIQDNVRKSRKTRRMK